ncbi:MAG: GNAT family N-acetyltransferase, partial [Tabrizicola sp.]
MTPHQCLAPYDWPALLSLIRQSFAGMEGRIDPPSSMHSLTAEAIAAQATGGEVWAIGTPPVACVFLTPQPGALYIGKLATAASHRRMGLAGQLIALAATRAKALGQLAQARVAGAPNGAGKDSAAAATPPGVMTPAAMQGAMGMLSIAGAEARLDGSVVRLEIPADNLFEADTANLLPG